ncbi:MAG TPA: ABC transporter ATP-binding protein [Actinomycetes bacterium]|nr:ABC transporter ATP-binding protein [Actinomycetes bacterium]
MTPRSRPSHAAARHGAGRGARQDAGRPGRDGTSRTGRRDRSGRRTRRAWLWPVLRPHRRTIALAAATVLAGTAAGLVMPYLVKLAVDDGVRAGDLGVVRAAVAAYLALTAVQFAALRAETLLIAKVGERALLAVRTRLFAHLQTLSLEFYERERTGRIVARMTSDVEALGDLVSTGLVNLVASLITLSGIAVVLVWLDWRLAAATLLLAPAGAVLVQRFRTRSGDAWREVRERATVVTVRLQEALTGIRTIQTFRREHATAQGLADANDAERLAHQRTIAYASWFFPTVELAGALASVIVLGYGGRRVLAGDLEIGTLVAFLLYLRSLFDPIQQLSGLYEQVQAANAGAERIGNVLAEQPTVREAAHPASLPAPRGDVRLAHVRFAYATDPPGEPAASPSPDPAADGHTPTPGPDVLYDVDLHAPAGTTLALVGPTGAGKSTVAKLIARFYDPQHGTVTLDGTDLRHIRLADLRAATGYLPQEGFLFSSFDGSVAANIAYGRPGATRAEVEAAAKAVGADEVIRRLPDGYDTEVGERGELLSAGERQLVSFARAWIADPALLILDEATSSLDAASEARINEALRRLRQGRTTIIIAHRLSTVAHADRIAVIEDGRVVETGTPAALRARGGRFAELYDRWLAGAA